MTDLENLDNVGEKYIVEDKAFWKGWKTFPLRMFGRNNIKNLNKCPRLKQILESDKNITSAFFSIMEPGKLLPSHYGPFKGILRYHLGLLIPKGNCFISVDDQIYDWVEGEGVLFDETYKHFVINDTDYHRIILFVDIKRPFRTYPLKKLNDMILKIMSIY